MGNSTQQQFLDLNGALVLRIHLDFSNNLDISTEHDTTVTMSTTFVRRTTRILVLNPNSSASMTHGVEVAIRGMNLPLSTEIYTYTAPPASPASINDGEDVQQSADVVMRNLQETGILGEYDAVLVACYSVHPLVHLIQENRPHLAVTGIFEASIVTSLSLLPYQDNWGIVTTGKFWEKHLSDGVHHFVGSENTNSRFAGVETTGLNAGDFHGGVDPAVVRQKLCEATKRLLDRGVQAVVMGCAGMAGLEDIIRSVATEERGEEAGRKLLVIDGVKAGVGLLEQMVRNKRMFQRS
ncbi:Asp/Glu/Hydantoin racemase-domain-containing protein [Cercophora samala]|uniref:Asp/Glu/Hydantoin racemase-domain-containing protein n=1 Tax=Cercophora samala TaxID=330535 RepID=A0AA39ZK04_9PEZI|nr:Asp/Glu/Hydantoin racemase-domain-containing protein [Cercophora samala]